MDTTLFYTFALSGLALLVAAAWCLIVPEKPDAIRGRLQEWLNWETYDQPNDRSHDRGVRLRTTLGFYHRIPGYVALQRTLEQVNSRLTPWRFALLILSVSGAGFVLIGSLTNDPVRGVIAALLAGSVPCFILRYHKQQYLKKFERQLPEALDMLARSLWAGNTLQVGMRNIGDDFDPPVSLEFNKTCELIDFGVSIPVALEEMAKRVDYPELRYFVTAVMVQRETGGNLADILARTAELIYGRLEFRERVKTLSAEGKLSSYVLGILPFLLFGFIYLRSPDYFSVLFESSYGKLILGGTVVWMIVGFFIVRSMTDIKA